VWVTGAFMWAMYGLSIRDQLYIAPAAVFAFTTYPLITYVVFWLWLPLPIMLARRKSTHPSHFGTSFLPIARA
jgi:hypothetical protein